MAAEPPAVPPAPRRHRYFFRAPSVPASIAYIVGVSAALGLMIAGPWDATRYLENFLLLFLVPALVTAGLTAPLAEALGGRFSPRRSTLLVLSSLALQFPLLLLADALDAGLPVAGVSLGMMFLLAQGPVLWFRHLSLFGVSNPSHRRTLPVSLLQPLLGLAGYAVVRSFTPATLAASAIFLTLGFLTSVQLLRAADRPMRREFQTSGVSLIRPMLDHINGRDPEATETLEAFFTKFSILANLSVSLIEFRAKGKTKATLAIPTVHPGPFAALGASDLPRKVADRLGPDAGLVLVPHCPCNHELDIPNRAGVERVLEAAERLRSSLGPPVARSGPLVTPAAGSLARAQLLGDTTVVLMSQAPAPTDDVAYAVGDALRRRQEESGEGPLALIDAHNSYVEDRGDIAYGTTVAARLSDDARAAIAAARSTAVEEGPEVGVASRTDYTLRGEGIGPAGIRVLAVRAGGRTAAYVLIDGNNLVQGYRERVLERLLGVVDDAEVMTTDNHIVHEVDGGTNPVGERMPVDRLAGDARALVEAAVRDLTPVEVRSGRVEIPEVPVLGPSWTERLLTSLGDTVSVFAHQAAATMLLLLVSSAVVVVALR